MSSTRMVSEHQLMKQLDIEQPDEIPQLFGLDTDFEPEEELPVEDIVKQHLAALETHDAKEYAEAFQHFSNVNNSVYDRPGVEPVDAAAMRTLAFLSHDVAEDSREEVFSDGDLEGEQLFETYGNPWELAKYFTKKEGEHLAVGEGPAEELHLLPDEYAAAENEFYRIHGEINDSGLTGDELEDRERDMWYAIRRSVELRFPGAGGGAVSEATEHYFNAVREGHDSGDAEAAAQHLTQFYDTLV